MRPSSTTSRWRTGPRWCRPGSALRRRTSFAASPGTPRQPSGNWTRPRARRAALGMPGPDGRGSASRGRRYAECERVGRKWRLSLGDRSVLVEDSVGHLHLAVLIANPRQDISAGRPGERPRRAQPPGRRRAAAGTGSAGRRRVPHSPGAAGRRDRHEAAGAARARPDQAKARDQTARARAEREWLAAQLASATGLGGRVRSFPDDAERARVAVGKAIRRALVRIDRSRCRHRRAPAPGRAHRRALFLLAGLTRPPPGSNPSRRTGTT